MKGDFVNYIAGVKNLKPLQGIGWYLKGVIQSRQKILESGRARSYREEQVLISTIQVRHLKAQQQEQNMQVNKFYLLVRFGLEAVILNTWLLTKLASF